MKIFLDTNVLLDIFMRREPYYDASAQVVYACERGQFTGGFTTLSACNIVYALRKQLGGDKTIKAIRQLVRIIEPIGTSVSSLLQSLEDPKTDFEDAVQSQCALEWNADAIITRDKSGFANSAIPVLTPSDFLLQHH